MSYKFVKIKAKHGDHQGTWYFVPQSVRQIIEHSEKVFKPHIQDGYNRAAEKVINAAWKYGNADFHDHFNNAEESAIAAVTDARGYALTPITLFETSNNLYLEAVQNRIVNFTDGQTVYLANGVQQFGFHPDYAEIVEEMEKDSLEYPDERELNLNDARYIQWSGGTHWYVKIGVHDVVDEHGNQKWNTKSEAEEATKWYCKYY